MIKLNGKGFALVEGLLILVIVGVISGVGYYVYNANEKTNESLDNTGNSEVARNKSAKEIKTEDISNSGDSNNKKTLQTSNPIIGAIVISEFNPACQSGAGPRACGTFKFKKELNLSEVKVIYGTNSSNLDKQGLSAVRANDEGGYTVYDFRIDHSSISTGVNYTYKITGKSGSQTYESENKTFIVQ